MDKKTCFVVSPIGPKDSDVRKNANDVYDLVIEPALEKYDFEIIRADKISAVTSITSEIVELVQNSDLCIIDITDHNPNVMYECGRRHETGKPYIMIAREGEKLPFDINTIRTIFYDCSDGREIRATVKTIQSFVDKMLSAGLEPGSSGESLASISETLRRIERHLVRVPQSTSAAPVTGAQASLEAVKLLKSLGHTGAFNYALSQRNLPLAEALLPHLEPRTPKETFIVAVLTQTTAMGSRIALDRLERELEPLTAYDKADRNMILGAYVAGLGIHDEEARGLEILTPYFEEVRTTDASAQDMTSTEKAHMLNQYQKLLHGAHRYEEARAVGEEVIRLAPDEPAYYYNQSMNYEACDDIDGAVLMIEQCMVIVENLEDSEVNDSHLGQAVQLYCRANRVDKARQFFNRL